MKLEVERGRHETDRSEKAKKKSPTRREREVHLKVVG
jgi:hypothetical protein